MIITLVGIACGSATCGGTADVITTSDRDTPTSSPPAPPEPAPATTGGLITNTQPRPESPLAGRVVVVDPGHNGRNGEHLDEINRIVDIGNGTKACNTTGTAADGLTEAQLNWDVAVRTVDYLRTLGADVVLTRQDNDGWGPCINERAAVGNDLQADAVVSIHADGGPAEGRGFHVIHPAPVPGLTDDIAEPSGRLAVILRDAVNATGMPIADYIAVGGLSERSDLGGLNLSDVPAVFLEMGNMKNGDDIALLTDGAFQDRIAEAIGAALEAFLGE